GVAELLEAVAVLVVLRVALLARRDRLLHAELLGVAVVALELLVRAEIEPRALAVIEERHVARVLLLEVLERRRVTPVAVLGVEQHSFVRALVAAAVAAVLRLGERQVELALRVTLETRDVLVRAEDRHAGVLAVVVVEAHVVLRRLPHGLAVAAVADE